MDNDRKSFTESSFYLSKEQSHPNLIQTKRRLSSTDFIPSAIHFGSKRHSGTEFWDTSYFLTLLCELFDEFKTNSNDESRLAAFLIYRLNESQFNRPFSNKSVIQILTYFQNIRLKILVFLELLTVCETIDCSQALMFLWQFSSYGYMTLFYVLDRMKFFIMDKDLQ